MVQLGLFEKSLDTNLLPPRTRPPGQLLKWVGNKYRHANEIVHLLPHTFKRYIEPFVGTGAVLATLAPQDALAGDTLEPLIDFWHLVQNAPETLVDYYATVWHRYAENPKKVYYQVRESFNRSANALDLLFLSRSCYGGVVRFTREGKMSTPIGPHKPIAPGTFEKRLMIWRERVKSTHFVHADFEKVMAQAQEGDVVYCDPPYTDSQAILYGSQSFSLDKLWEAIDKCVSAGARVALSIDGRKKSGKVKIDLDIPTGLFQRETFLNCGTSMLRRFQKQGETMQGEIVHDRLLLSW
jgi:DNA adenine methylase